MKQLTNLLAALCLSLMACTQIQGMNRNVAVYPQALCIMSRRTDPDRLGPITIEPITEEDRLHLSMIKYRDIEKSDTYLQNRTLMAKAVLLRQPHWIHILGQPYWMHIRCQFDAAILHQDGPFVKLLLENNNWFIDPNKFFEHKDIVPPLFQSQSVKMAQLLVSHGASFTEVEKTWNNTILHHACREHSAELLEYYLLHATNVNNPRYRTSPAPLNVWSDPALNGPNAIDVNIQRNNRDRRTPLHVWAEHALGYYGPKASGLPLARKKLALLIAAGADCALKDAQGKTALAILNEKIAKYKGDSLWSKGVSALSTLKAELVAAMSAPQIPTAPALSQNNSPTQDCSITQNNSPAQDCSICLCPIAFPYKLTCNHEFCKNCILTALNTGLNCCPLCRDQIIK